MIEKYLFDHLSKYTHLILFLRQDKAFHFYNEIPHLNNLNNNFMIGFDAFYNDIKHFARP
jgi:hypothetical protein